MKLCFIFDMDGLLVDSEPIWHRAEREVVRRWSAETGSNAVWSDDDAAGCTGRGIPESARRMAVRAGRDFDPDVDPSTLIAAFLARASEVEPCRGAFEALAFAREHGRVALASSSPLRVVRTLMTAQKMIDYFDVVVTGDHVTSVKPDPSIFLEAARQLEAPPERCVVLEDSPAGVAAGRRAGMLVIAVPTASMRKLVATDLPEGAHHVVEELFEAIGLLKKVFVKPSTSVL